MEENRDCGGWVDRRRAMARALFAQTTTAAKSDIYAFFFDQEGLMAGIGLQGSKITRING